MESSRSNRLANNFLAIRFALWLYPAKAALACRLQRGPHQRSAVKRELQNEIIWTKTSLPVDREVRRPHSNAITASRLEDVRRIVERKERLSHGAVSCSSNPYCNRLFNSRGIDAHGSFSITAVTFQSTCPRSTKSHILLRATVGDPSRERTQSQRHLSKE